MSSASSSGRALVRGSSRPVHRGEWQIERRVQRLLVRWRARLARPEGPLVVLFAGFPVWWILGLSQVAIFTTSLAMAFRLLRWRRLVVPTGFRVWLLFLIWVLLGACVVQANAPYAVVGDNPNRYLTWALRLVWYLEATVVLLYVANVRKSLPPERLSRVLAIMFFTVTVGGLAGSFAPTTALRSVTQMILPGGLTGNAFVSSFIHPVLAQRLVYIGDVQYRPSAPFPYANEWGSNYACFLPFFVQAWCRRAAGRRRVIGLSVLLISLVPVIYSLNRGLWAALIVMAIITVIKHTRQGHGRSVAMLTAGAVIVALVIALSPLGGALSERFTGHNSNDGRTRLSLTSVAAVAQASPVIGLGTTRDVQGSFYSIAGGSTPSCPSCSPPPFGTQGFLWLLLYANGFVGAVLGLAFFLLSAWRHRRLRGPTTVASLCSLSAFLLTLAIYDWSETAVFAVMAAIAMLGGTASDAAPDAGGRLDPGRLRPMAGFAEPRLVMVCGLIGLVCATGLHAHRGTTYSATASIYLPATSKHAGLEPGAESTLDTQARFVSDPIVARAISSLSQGGPGAARVHLTVNASPNTRILNLVGTSSDPARAVAAADAAARAMIRMRSGRLTAAKSATASEIDAQVQGAIQAVITIDSTINELRSGGPSTGRLMAIERLRRQRAQLQGRVAALRDQADLLDVTAAGGWITQQPEATAAPQQWNVAAAGGLGLGILIAVLISGYRTRRGEVVASLSEPQLRRALGGKRVLTVGDPGPEPADTSEVLHTEILRSGGSSDHGGALCRRCRVAAPGELSLQQDLTVPRGEAFGVFLLTCPHRRLPAVQEWIARLARANVSTAGVAIWMHRRSRTDMKGSEARQAGPHGKSRSPRPRRAL